MRPLSLIPSVGDPSHNTGHWYPVTPLMLSAILGDAHPLIDEMCPAPQQAPCDGPLSLAWENLDHLTGRVRVIDGVLRAAPVRA